MPESQRADIVLIAPNRPRIQVGAVAHLPLALLSIAAWIQRKTDYRNRIKILDTQIQRPESVDFSHVPVVGISAMTGNQITGGLEVAAMARAANPQITIVWGGIHPTLVPEQTVRHPLVDVVVRGEGEQTFLDVLDAIFAGREPTGIPGTTTLTTDGKMIHGPKQPLIDLDDLPLPAYDLVDVTKYKGITHQFDYQSSRGCPFRCGFCYNTAFHAGSYRSKSPANVLEELHFLSKKHDVINFGFVDDEFFADQKRVKTIFEGLTGDFGLVASCRLDLAGRMSPDFMNEMNQKGVKQIFFGAESGSEEILEMIQKGISTQDIISGALRTAEHGIRPILSFMSGFPGETMAHFKQTIDLILSLQTRHPLVTVNGIFPFNAYPGTALYDRARKLGLASPDTLEQWGDWDFQYKPNYPWIPPKMKIWMEIAFIIIRFRYYLARYEDRTHSGWTAILVKLLIWPLSLSARIRLNRRWFFLAWEWKLFAFVARKTFGYR